MLGYTVAILYLFYGLWKVARLWKQHMKHDAIVLGIVSMIIIGYLIPATGGILPNPESLNKSLYQPLSDYVQLLLMVKKGVHAG